MNLKIIQLTSTPSHEFMLNKYDFSEVYTAILRGSNNGLSFELRESAVTPEEAVDALYSKWLHLTDRVPELRAALPAPFEEVSDDEIPF